MMNEDTNAWRRVAGEELGPALNCEHLSADGVALVRRSYRAAAVTAARTLVDHLGRFPTQAEFNHVLAAVVRQFNEVAIPALEAAEDRHSTPPKHGV